MRLQGKVAVLTDIRDDLGERAAAELRSIPGIASSGRTPKAPSSAPERRSRSCARAAALQYAKENIGINSVHPGYADTPLTVQRFSDPAMRQVLLDCTLMSRLGTAGDIANGVLFLASDESSWVRWLGRSTRWRPNRRRRRWCG